MPPLELRVSPYLYGLLRTVFCAAVPYVLIMQTVSKSALNRKPEPHVRGEHARDNMIIIAALIAGLMSLLFNWFGTGYAINHLLEDEAKAKAVSWGVFLQNDLVNLDQLLIGGEPSFIDANTIDTAVGAGNIIRYKFFDQTGKIVHASRTSDIGSVTRNHYFQNIVMKGETFAKIDVDDMFEENQTYVSEAYIPIMENGVFQGAIEVYSDVTMRANEMLKFRIWAFVVLCGFTLLLGGLLAVVVVRRKLAQEIAEQSLVAEQALKDVNEELEERVSHRTHELRLEIQSHLETETELVDAMIKAERANAAKSAFLSSVSHELRTPMNAIMGFAQVLQLSARGKLDKREMENVAQIIENGDTLVGLIDQILDLSKLETEHTDTQTSEFRIDELLTECVNEFQADADRNDIAMTAVVGSCIGTSAAVDRNCLKQALLNLISNAIKYNTANGSVEVTCESSSGGAYKIAVKDTGVGIPDEHHDSVFQSFERLGQEGKTITGAGVGLSISKSLVELINGNIGFESAAGKGSTFWIELPRPDLELLAPE